MSREVFDLLECALSQEVEVDKVITQVLEEVLPDYCARPPVDRKEWVIISSNIVISTLKLLKGLPRFKLTAIHVRNMGEVVAALLSTKRSEGAKIRDHPFKEKKEERAKTQWGSRQEPKSAIPAIGNTSFGPKIEEVKEKEEED